MGGKLDPKALQEMLMFGKDENGKGYDNFAVALAEMAGIDADKIKPEVLNRMRLRAIEHYEKEFEQEKDNFDKEGNRIKDRSKEQQEKISKSASKSKKSSSKKSTDSTKKSSSKGKKASSDSKKSSSKSSDSEVTSGTVASRIAKNSAANRKAMEQARKGRQINKYGTNMKNRQSKR